jgi:hypothetical protein
MFSYRGVRKRCGRSSDCDYCCWHYYYCYYRCCQKAEENCLLNEELRNFLSIAKYYSVDYIKGDEMGRARSMHRTGEKCVQTFSVLKPERLGLDVKVQ